MTNLKHVVVVLSILSILAGGVYTLAAHVEKKVSGQLQPIKDDVKAIRNLLENYLLQELRK